jgi:inosine-uridine nucleoside N-ribohydrolase
VRVRPLNPVLLALAGAALWAQDPPAVIVDTDLLTDCDDAGALAVLHALADRGEVRLLGVVLDGQDTTGKHGAVASAIDRYYGRGDLPIGVDRRPAGMTPRKTSSYAPAVFAEFPNDGLLDEQRPDALAVYRRLLVAAPDRGVTIIGIGFLTNLDTLLRSPGDALDARDGLALVRAKVRGISLMGGRYPTGAEHNFTYAGAVEATRAVLATWPDAQAPMVFCGYELGAPLITGQAYRQAPASPMRRCYELAYHALEKGRPSWDQTAVLHAVRGLGPAAAPYWTAVPGSIHLDETGGDSWAAAPARGMSYLVRSMEAKALATELERLMAQAPGSGRP